MRPEQRGAFDHADLRTRHAWVSVGAEEDQEHADTEARVVKDWPAVGPPFALSIVGTLGWVAAVGALALAARRQGAPRLEWIFVGLAAVLLLGGHPFPAGTLAFACFFAAALLHELRGSS
jgi:hypothetical protein